MDLLCILEKINKQNKLLKYLMKVHNYTNNITIKMIELPTEIIIIILENLPLQNLIKLERVRHYIKEIIRNEKWKNLTIYILSQFKVIYKYLWVSLIYFY